MRESLLPVAVLSLDHEERGSRNVAQFVKHAVACGSRLVVVPYGFPDFEGGAARTFYSELAIENRIHVIAGFPEQGKRIAAVFAPDGTVCGEYAQTHRLPGEDFVEGDRISPIQTSLGSIGLSIGSDLFFPEVQWSLAQQGTDFLVHLDVDRGVNDHFYSILSPRGRAMDVQRPFLIARPTSNLIKLVHNEELGIPGTPMAGSVIIDQNGAILGSSAYSQGVARADLRMDQHCRSPERESNIPLSKGLDIWKLYFNDSRGRFFEPLCAPYSPLPKPAYKKRKIRVAVLSHPYKVQVGGKDGVLLALLEKALQSNPDIVVSTEMEADCRPDDPEIALFLEKMVEMAKAAGSYLLMGGIRVPDKETRKRRTSHAWLWERDGRRVFDYRIMLNGQGCGQESFDADFGRIGVRLCGDIYVPELDRLFALKGVDIVFNPSMSWGASGLINTELNQVRAMDNGHFVVSAHLAFSDAGQRSHVIDPMGMVVAASEYYNSSVLLADIDLDAQRGIFIPEGAKEVPDNAYLAKYRSPRTHQLLCHSEVLKMRRPGLYKMLDFDCIEHPFTTRDRGDGRKIV